MHITFKERSPGLLAIPALVLMSALQTVPSEATMRPDPATVDDLQANRLIDETSPYLLQHAYNPVDWYPWGEEAFEKARLEDKPIFSERWIFHVLLVSCHGTGIL